MTTTIRCDASGTFGSLQINGSDVLRYGSDTSGQLTGFRNYIINGGCVVGQRGNVAAVKDVWTYGGSDRTCVNIGGTTASGTIQRYGVSSTATGFAQGVQATTTGAGAVFFQQCIESWNTIGLNSKTITVSCLVYQNTGSALNAAIVIGKPTTTADTFSAQTALSTSGNFSIPSSTPTRISWTYTLGAAEATLGLYAQVGFASVGVVTAKDFWIGDFQLEVGSIATPFEVRPYVMELLLCQRYYYAAPIAACYVKWTSGSTYIGQDTLYFPVTMRTTSPTFTNPTWTVVNCAAPTVAGTTSISKCFTSTATTTGTTSFYNSTEALFSSEL